MICYEKIPKLPNYLNNFIGHNELGSVQTVFFVPKIVGFSEIKGDETHDFGKFGILRF